MERRVRARGLQHVSGAVGHRALPMQRVDICNPHLLVFVQQIAGRHETSVP